MTARDEAIEAAARAIFGGADEVWDAVPAEQAHYRRAAERAVAAAVPLLLNDLADHIDEGIDDFAYTTSDCEDMAAAQNNAVERASALVRAAAEGWGATNG